MSLNVVKNLRKPKCQHLMLILLPLTEAFILIPAGLIVGIGEACFWPSAILFTMHYARCYARAGPQSAEQYTTQFLGILFSGLSLSEVRNISTILTFFQSIP